ncbi:MAG: BatA domain-containing protein [Planctomycetia bacterium]|nr:BatA domain-containing protein [Planctomycetia bacterium]
MPSFLYPPLVWGLLLAGLPVLIHLINMMRHRRVRWAAMEFLLVSQKKNRTWVLLKQLLLLLLRAAAIATLVLAVAQPLVRNELGILFGGSRTHHVVLLDDSFSMSDRWAGTSAMDEAKSVVQRIGAMAQERIEPQRFTLLRFSQAGRVGRDTQPDMLEETVDSEFTDLLAAKLHAIAASQSAAGPGEAIHSIDQLLGESDDENRIVYLISDFRARQWDQADDLRNQLAALAAKGVALHLVNCVDRAQPNLALTNLAAASGTRAAGVPLVMEVTVENFGDAPARDVPVILEEDGHARPAVKFESLPPRRAVTERFLVRFPTAGQHQIIARLDSDVVAADNYRFGIVDFPVDVPVLIVDGSLEAQDARFLSAALAPGAPAQTGISPRIETPRYLSLNPLDAYQVIYLANVDRLDESAVEALEQYVKAGGGLAVFLGPRCRATIVNEQLYRDGKGLLPMPLSAPAELLVDRVEKTPDLDVTDHPMFRVFAGQRNTFLSMVNVSRYFAVPDDWRPAPGSTARVIARLRNGAPLAVEQAFGEGRVIAVTTTAAPVWNNWATNNPSFVVAIQEMQAYLARRPAATKTHLVGEPLGLQLPPGKYEPKVRFTTPEDDGLGSPSVDAVPSPDGSLVASLAQTDTSGVYRAQLTATDGTSEVRQYAVNVDPLEGDLAAISGEQLASRLEGVPYDYRQAAAFGDEGPQQAGYNLGTALLYVLVGMLLVEQILAWSCTYHPPNRAKTAGGGAA